MAVEGDALGPPFGAARLGDVVQQGAEGERLGRPVELLEQEQRVPEDVALGVKVRGLLDAFQRRDLRQDLRQQAGLVEQLEAAASGCLP